MRGLVRFLLLLLVMTAIFWLGLWWYAEGRLELAVDQSVTAMRKAGWTVSHGPVIRGTSPLRAQVMVEDIKLTPPDRTGRAPNVVLPGVLLRVRPSAPLTLDLALPTEWRIGLAAGPQLSVRFATIRDSYQFDLKAVLDRDPNPVRSGTFRATGMRVDGANTNFTLVSIAGLEATGIRDPLAGTSATAFSMHEKLTGVALSPIFTTLGNLPFDGKLKELTLDFTMSGPPIHVPHDLLPPSGAENLAAGSEAALAAWKIIGPAVHDWAAAGGHGTFGLGLKLGPLDARESGTFGFDDSTQPTAKVHLVADGLDATLGAIASRYPDMVDDISRLTAASAPYMSKGPKGGQRLKIDLELAHGVLSANGNKLVDVPRVVWPKAGAAAK